VKVYKSHVKPTITIPSPPGASRLCHRLAHSAARRAVAALAQQGLEGLEGLRATQRFDATSARRGWGWGCHGMIQKMGCHDYNVYDRL